MIEETGVVVEVNENDLLVTTNRKSTCGSCSAKAGCGTGVLDKWFNRKQNVVRVLNTRQQSVDVGNEVVIGVDESALVRGSAIVYILPLLIVFLFTFIADRFASNSLHVGEGFVILVALIAGVLSFMGLKRFSNSIKHDPRYQPILLRKSISISPESTA